MPTSDFRSISPIMEEIVRLQPARVLDLGAGCGKYGVLCREYLDKAQGRFNRAEWLTQIDGVEGFDRYIGPLHFAVYDYMFCEDFAQCADDYEGYNLVLMIDSLEHLEEDTGKHVLETLLKNNARVIVSVPCGVNFLEQGAVYGNEFERHRTNWDTNYFRSLGGVLLHASVCTVFSIPGKRSLA